ncbi:MULTISPECIES: (2Fe-2S)-binding protein [unclassified Colwellia]|jgi:isoquinoline 1-oxidoreductase alpha subunit|uniref:(2Fe-2S)-binding protein n=1 Tax=unclassified Colwellia TaxID=196834 RepID=UPI0015F73638|nr:MULTISPECIES: (2Fe-2S)-binding protein [unclassified Colwellia]MBA6364367.1 (2Fe-2S)-binding protein [Colwellia sp. BRX8-8]MBA6337042.1 (2Fe-2S)-binding protein [Colwellia sp. BRX8-7]MBA6349748.1 (2Fe-2S)-binding protein [Colwellia sp. BRX8-9]MBA6353662.1 (2Fe-2S)-binding protein [Colwellia sp. BRX9-1]MBA6356388.1 (2Fe-2S)-binding protein [Colwellia sp. BRX8-3]|tara:strand:- start:959 stop:1417 length:459 start_codon:yes stop_codon:yes gene_type:complete
MISINLNGREQLFDVEDDMPLLWLIREEAGLRGTKFGCGIAQCGACTVHVDNQAVRSCMYPAVAAQGKQVNTVETLGSKEAPHALQAAWIKHQVPQCGYCQSGMMMAAAALLASTPNPSSDDIDTAMTNICRCGTYSRVKAAILDVAKEMSL